MLKMAPNCVIARRRSDPDGVPRGPSLFRPFCTQTITVSSRTRSAIGASAASLALTLVVNSTTVFGAIASSRVTASTRDVRVSRPTSRSPSARIASTWSGRATTVT